MATSLLSPSSQTEISIGREKSACKEMLGEGGKPSEREKSIWTLLSFLFFFEGAVGRAEWLSEHQMNVGIHTGSGAFQLPFKPRALLERAPKALCRGPWEGSSCLQYLSRHRERDGFVPGCGGQDESPAEKKGAFCLLQQRFAGSPVSARGSPSPRNPVVPHPSPVVPWHSVHGVSGIRHQPTIPGWRCVPAWDS